jgi:anti-sigma B factor antagonist
MTEKQPRIRVDHRGDVCVVDLLDHEILDELTINEIAESLFAVVDEQAEVKLVLNFQEVTHLSSSALGTLIRLNKKIEEAKGLFRLCSIKESLYEIFVITRLNKVFTIHDDIDAAIKSL